MSPLLLQGNTNQYNINGLLCTYTEMFRIQTCCNHILLEGFRDRRQHARIQEFLSVLFSPQLIIQFTEGVQWYNAEKTILILDQGSRGGPLFSSGGGVSNFFQGGPNANFFRNPYTYLLFSRGGPDPLSPSGSAHGQCHHNGTIFITVPLLTIKQVEVFQMMHWYCARLTPSRNTALGSGSFCNSAFFFSKISTTSTQ